MEKRLRSSLKTSADEFLTSATKLGLRSSKPSLKALIHSLNSSSPLISSLPLSLHQFISQSIAKFIQLSGPTGTVTSPQTPPTKRLRRSGRKKNDGVSATGDKLEIAKKSVVESLQIYAYVALLCVLHPKKVFTASDLLPAVSELHDNLVLFESDSNLLSEIANLCEEWWKEQLPGKEALISQSLPFLLSRSLTLKKKVDVHRVYSLREAFTLFDFEDESIEDLKLLLIRCLIAPFYLKMDEGRKFLAFMFGLSRQLVKEVLAMVKSQIPFGRKSMLEAYADIIFRAWRSAESESREVMEDEFLQGLVESSIHASSVSLSASVRRILGGFISQRTTDGVEKLLFRLAEPVIFRSLQVANSNVRQNALHLLIDLFPLEDPDATREVKDTLLEKQFFLFERLLMDECPDVRIVAVEGSCRILHLFWEIIPAPTITKLITQIFDDMAHDLCNEVRLSTVNGIIYLLGNPLSHEILKVLLPRLGHLILDSSLSVRAAAVDLLLFLKDIRGFHFHKVVRLDILLSTLANDQSLVAQKVTKLLIPSYFPSKVTPEEACSRCVTLIKRSPLAGARFCEFALSEGASLQFLLELFKVFTCLVVSPDNLSAEQIDGLLVAAAYLCNNLASEASYRATLKEELSGEKLKCLFAAATTGRAQSSVCNIVSIISPDAIDALVEECMTLVTNCAGLSDDGEKQAEVRSTHKMMLSCDWFSYMFEELTRLLQKTAQGCHTMFSTETPEHGFSSAKRRKVKSPVKVPAKCRRTSGKKPSSTATRRFDKDYEIALGIAWQFKDLLASEDTRDAMLGSRVLQASFYALKVISEVSIIQCLHCDYMETSPILAYTSLSLHMSLNNVKLKGTNNHGPKMKDYHASTSSSSERALLEQTIDHLFHCADKIFRTDRKSSKEALKTRHVEKRANSGEKHRRSHANDGCHKDAASAFSKQKRIANMVKMLTAILKFIVDSITMDLVSQYQERCLIFAQNYVEFVISNLREHSRNQLQFRQEDLKEIFLCLKSSFTYAAKLLNLILTNSLEISSPSAEAYKLSNKLLDLIISIEGTLGSGYGDRILSAAKPWLPDLIIALGSVQMQKESQGAFNHDTSSFPSWPSILAKLELIDLSEADSDEEGDRGSNSLSYSAFKKLAEMMTQLLRANRSILDAVGALLLTGSLVGLEREDFELLLGLLHFVCAKLVHENQEWEDLNLMLESIREIYPQIERLSEELTNSDGKHNLLERARALLEPVWKRYRGEDLEEPMETECPVD